jgi:hypothetical protein
MQQICSLVCHQELRAIGRSQDQRSGRAQSGDNDCIFSWNIPFQQHAPDFTPVPSRGYRRFHRYGQTMQWTAWITRAFKSPRLCTDALRLEVGKRIQFRIEAFDLANVRFRQLDNRDIT